MRWYPVRDPFRDPPHALLSRNGRPKACRGADYTWCTRPHCKLSIVTPVSKLVDTAPFTVMSVSPLARSRLVLRSVRWWVSSREGDEGPGAAEVDERDEGAGGVEAEAAVADRSNAAVEPFEAPVVEPEADGGEDPVAVAADGAGELDERLQPRAGGPGEPGVEVLGGEGEVLELVERGCPGVRRTLR